MVPFFALFLGLFGVITAQDTTVYVCNPCELRIAPRVAEKLLLHRVEPDYPQSEKLQESLDRSGSDSSLISKAMQLGLSALRRIDSLSRVGTLRSLLPQQMQ
jgi:hypothetical protein